MYTKPRVSKFQDSVFASLTLLTLMSSSTMALAEQPSQPANLRHQVYSSSAVELFWARPAAPGLSYEIKRNGTVQKNTDGVSFYEDKLNAGTMYSYQVTAINKQGERSTPATVSVKTADRGSQGTITPTQPGPAATQPGTAPSQAVVAVAAPSGVRASVYSSSSAELFWNRSTTFGLTYEIKRDGKVVKTTDGISFYDGQLSAAKAYAYQLTAINSKGERSAPVTVNVDTKSGLAGVVTPAQTGSTPTQPGTTPTQPATNPTPPGTTPAQPAAVLAAPTGVRASVYSTTTAELFWNRPSTPGLNYEIQRDGKLVKTTDGVSYYDSSLKPGTAYTYQIVAMNSKGQRSTPSSIMVNTQAGSAPGATNPGTNPGTSPGTNTGVNSNNTTPVSFSLEKSPATAIREPDNYYNSDGYDAQDVIRIDIKTATTKGTCKVGDLSGCTLTDLLADVDKNDDLEVEIPVHFKSDDFAEDGSLSNATMRLRGSGSRLGAQKSFRIKLDSKDELWRNERFIQLNKSPFDSSRIRNRLAFDMMSEIPHMPSIRTQFVNLWIDDGKGPVDQGLYHHVERINGDYLKRRGFDAKGNLYSAEDFTFDRSDLSDVSINADGSPKNVEFFEKALSISEGKDHRPLIAMLTALHNPDRTFVSVLDQYFDRNNVITWMAANVLLRQADAVRHNYYLYNPSGSQKFYFLPWDYDEAMGSWKEPPNNFESDSLRQRADFGYAVGEPSVFISRFLRLPGMHQEMIKAVDYIRQNYLTDAYIAEKAEKYIRIAERFELKSPDKANNPYFNVSTGAQFAKGPADNEQALKSLFSIPMPPTLYQPELQGSQWRFSWKPAYDVTGHGVSYELQVASSPSFRPDDLVVNKTGIKDTAGIVEQRIDASQLRSGSHYARLIARASNDPGRFWQLSLNRLEQDGKRYYGVMKFRVP